jgi:HemY protein
MARGETVQLAPNEQRGGRLDTRPVAIEERTEHGVPRLRE